ncbi:MAG: cell wall hydrolase [Halothermotrichaceae bacterium]
MLKLTKYTCIFTILILLAYSFIPLTNITKPFYSTYASFIDEDDIYKGVALALVLYFLSQSGEDEAVDKDIRIETSDDVNDDDRDLLASLIYAESRGESLEGQIAVGAVVLNRVESVDFPNTIREVIYQKEQFTPITNGQIDLIPNSNAYRAADMALSGEDPSLGALFFYNPKKARTLDWLSTRKTTIRIGDHIFAK